MSVEQFILHHLTEKGEAKVSHFGVFSLKKTAAIFDEQTQTFSPPAQQILFYADENLHDTSLASELASERNLSYDEAESLIEDIVNNWKQKLYNGETFVLEHFGRFIKVGNDILLQGEKITKDNPDFYGLETLNLDTLKNKRSGSKSRFVWIIILIIIMLLLGVLFFLSFEKRTNCYFYS